MKNTSMLMGMFLDVATDEEIKTLNNLFKKKLYGPAETYCVRLIRKEWVRLINQCECGNKTPQKSNGLDHNHQAGKSDSIDFMPRFIFAK